MADTLAHRGPDGSGVYTEGAVGLAHRRLSIIDLAGGSQPMIEPTSGAAITFNGEIYNYLELRKQLLDANVTLQTSSDTEVILHLYRLHGAQCVQYLRGMFAFAIWDPQQQILFLARDRVGKKPLYYADVNGSFIFASEAKALLVAPDVSRDINLSSLHSYLTLQYVPAPLSMFRDIQKLPPGHTAIVSSEGVTTEAYWNLRYYPKAAGSESELLEQADTLLAEAVRIRMISEVPLGAFLSGGIDSSLVVAYMAQSSPSPVKTFSVGFEEDEFNELPYARAVATHYGTDHHEFICRPDAAAILPRMVWHFDEPFGDASAVPTFYLAQVTRQHVTVALNGDGGDEAFGGYERYRGNALAKRYMNLLPRVVRGELIKPMLSAAHRLVGPNRLLRRLQWLNDVSLAPVDGYIRFMQIFDGAMKADLYSPQLRSRLTAQAEDYLRAYYGADGFADDMDRMLYCDTMTYLPGDLLVKVDRMTMAHGLEGRSPLLDHQVMEFAATLPTHLKRNGMTLKYLLKRLASRYIPHDLVHRKKQGFGVPLDRWFRTDLAPVVQGALRDSGLARAGYLDQRGIDRYVREHVEARANHGHRLWVLLNLELWYQMFVLRHELSSLTEISA